MGCLCGVAKIYISDAGMAYQRNWIVINIIVVIFVFLLFLRRSHTNCVSKIFQNITNNRKFLGTIFLVRSVRVLSGKRSGDKFRIFY